MKAQDPTFPNSWDLPFVAVRLFSKAWSFTAKGGRAGPLTDPAGTFGLMGP